MTIRKLLNCWLGKKRSGFYLSLGILSAAAYAAENLIQSPKSLSLMLKPAGFLGFLATILAFFIHLNLHAAHWLLDHFKDMDRLPKKQIALVNSVSMTVFTVLAAASLPGAAFLLEPLWQLAGRWLSGRMSLDQAVYPALYMQSQPLETPDFSALLADARPTAPWISLLDKIFRTAGTFLLLLLAVLAIRILFSRIWAWIVKPRHFDSDEKIYLTPVWPPSPAGKLLPHKKRKGFRLSYDEKIRQKYRRKILSLSLKRKQTPALSATPAELEQSVELCQPILHQLYEKARYSKSGCTKADWEILSEAEDI